MRKIVVMTMIEGAKLSAIETLNKYCERDEELKKVVDCQGGVIIYPVHKPFNERFYNEDECKWEGNPGIPYELVGQIFKEFGAKQSDHILYPGFDFARTRKAEFIKPSEEWLKRFKDRDQLFAFENMKSFAEHGLVVLEFSSLIDRTVFGKHDQYNIAVVFAPNRSFACDQHFDVEFSRKIAEDIRKSRNIQDIAIGYLTTIDLRDILKKPDEGTGYDFDAVVEGELKHKENKDIADLGMDKARKAIGIKYGFIDGMTNGDRYNRCIKPKVIDEVIEKKPDNLLLTIFIRISDDEFEEFKEILTNAKSLYNFIKNVSIDYMKQIVLAKINTTKYVHNNMCFVY